MMMAAIFSYCPPPPVLWSITSNPFRMCNFVIPIHTCVKNGVLELLEFDSNSNTNIKDFYYCLIILIGIELGMEFSLELGAVFSAIQLLESEWEPDYSNLNTLAKKNPFCLNSLNLSEQKENNV